MAVAASGLDPGMVATRLRRTFAGTPGMLPGTHGFLDAGGRAEGAFVAGPGQLLALAGMRIDWAASVLGKGPPLATNAVGFDVLP